MMLKGTRRWRATPALLMAACTYAATPPAALDCAGRRSRTCVSGRRTERVVDMLPCRMSDFVIR